MVFLLKRYPIGLIALFFLLPARAPAIDSYALLDELLPKEHLPRVLNSEDIQINPGDPQPVFSPSGDFDGDGVEDMAISGIYMLPSGTMKYFLLVGTKLQNPTRHQKLFFQEYGKPVFLHKPGTTGERDPGNQAFSFTSCANCSDGFDAYWDPQKQTFNFRAWEKRVRRYQQLSHAPETDLVPTETVDQALKIVGELKDVQIYVAGLKKKGGTLATRVKHQRPLDLPNIVQVTVIEKRNKKELLYDEITVDLLQGTIVNRKRKKFKKI